MSAFKIISFGVFCFSAFLASLALGSKCPEDDISKLVVCYYEGETSLTNFNICNCTHVVFTNAVKRVENNSITATEGTIKLLEIIKGKKENLSTIFTLRTKPDETSKILKSENKTENLINGIVEFLHESQFDGIELDFKFRFDDGIQKDTYASFVKVLSKTLSHQRRVKREGYDVFEKLQDDITTASYTTQTPKNSTSKTQSIKRRYRKPKQSNRKIREKSDDENGGEGHVTLEEAINAVFSEEKPENRDASRNGEEKEFLIFVRLSVEPEILAKKYDLKMLSRYADILSVPTHNMVNSNEEHLTYHPSRLMGLSDILNTDSILDLLTGMGAVKSKMVISIPGTVLKFQLKEEKKNTPRSPSVAKPQVIDQSQLCLLFSKNNWTIERDDDLTGPYAFSGKTWLAFEDEISVNIKGKYILLRDLAGGAIYPIDADVNDGLCTNRTGSGGYLSGILYKNFASLGRKPRALVLESLQEEIHDSTFTNIEAGVKLSEYRIVRVVDHSGAVHVIRKNTKTQFECSRQGYFSHPLGCNKFYRCVKFDQYSDEFTVFEYDCPAGLAFDERWEVCVWPGSLPHGAPCTGSSEIAPVPRSHYRCPAEEGYYSDPENCRWFFACLDHARDGVTPLTAYEFRCPFGLVFSEAKLACDWPWLVGSCGNRGAVQGVHSATFINGGNLEASFGQYDTGFGGKFEGAGTNSAQTAGFGYIAGQFEDNHSRAAFAAFPEYEISGGRILNRGGFVLDQNVAGIAAGGSGVTAGVKGKGFGYLQQGNIFDAPNLKFQQLEIGSGGEASFLDSVSTPKPFSVSIPSVQINSETLSQHSTVGSTTPQTLLFESVPQTENINVRLTSSQQEYSGQPGQPTGLPFVTSTGKLGAAEGFSSSISFASTPRTEVHRFDQSGKKISLNQGSVTTGVSAVGVPQFEFDSNPISVVTPKPGVLSFEHTASGFGLGVSQSSPTETPFGGRNEASVTAGIPVVTASQYGSGPRVAIPVVTPKPVQALKYTASDVDIGVRHSSPTASPVVGFTQQDFGGKTTSVSVEIPAVQTHVIQHLKEGQIFAGQTGVSYGAAVSPSVYESDRKTGSFSSKVSYRPSTIDAKVSNELKYNRQPHLYTFSQTASEKSLQRQNTIPAVTPKPDYQIFSQSGANVLTGKTEAAVSYGVSAVTPRPGSSSFYEEHNSAVGVTPIVPFDSSGISKDFSRTIVNVPPVVQQQQSGISQSSYSIPVGTSEVKSIQSFVTPSPYVFGQRYSYSSSGTIEPFGVVSTAEKPAVTKKTEVFLPTAGQSNVLTEVSIEQQPIVPYGTTKTVPVTYYSQPQNSVYSNINHKSSHAQQQQVTVTNPDTVVLTSSPHSVSIVDKQQGSSDFQQNVKSFVSVGHVTTPGTLSYEHEIRSGLGTSNSYLPPVTPKTEIFGSSARQFVTPEKAQVLLQEDRPKVIQPFGIEAKSFGEKLSVETVKPFTPQEKLVELEITKSVELNPAEIGQVHFPPDSTPKPIVIQQQPLHLISEKKFSTKQVVQPFYQQQEKETGQIFGDKYQGGYFYQHQVNIETPKTDKQYLPPSTTAKPKLSTISYNADKTVNIGQSVYSAGINNVASELPSVTYSTPKTIPQPAVYPAVTPKSPSVTYSTPKTIFQSAVAPELPSVTYSTSQDIGQPAAYPAVAPEVPSVTYSTARTVIQPASYSAVAPELPSVTYSTPKTILQPAAYPGIAPKLPSVTYSTPRTVIQPASYSAVAPELPSVTYSTSQDIGQPAAYPGIAPKLASVTYSTPRTVIQPAAYPAVAPEVPSVTYSTPKTILQPAAYPAVAPEVPSVTYSTPKTILQPAAYPDIAPKLPSVTYSTPRTVIQPASYSAVAPELPSVTYSTPKAVVEPAVYSEDNENAAPVLPVFEASRIPLTSSKETFRTTGFAKNVYVDSSKPQKVNLLLPQTQTDELSLQTHGSFDFQKVNKYGGASGFKYVINPNIEIPDPPKEYILAQNAFTTATPETVTATQSTTAERTEFKGSTYLPPSRRKPSKTTVISVGSLNEKEATDDNIQQLLDRYSGRFGQTINNRNEKLATKVIKGEGRGRIEVDRQSSSTVQYEVSSTTPRSRPRGRQYYGGITSGVPATNKYEEYEINGGQRSFDTDGGNADASKTTLDLKNLKLDKNKKTVIVVSQVSDANPVLIGKLAGQCSCQSNMLELRTKNKKIQQQSTAITNEYLPPFETNSGAQSSFQTEVSTPATDESKSFSHSSEQNFISSSTTAQPDSSTILSSLGPEGVLSITPKSIYNDDRIRYRKKQFRGRTRYLPPSPALSEDGLSLVPASEIASTFDYSILRGDESRTQNEIDGGKAAGAAFDRYGPGGWRGFDETLQGSIDCKRPGLFRHPKHCNKFYACNYDPWKERYTLHVFNCPIHLTYDSSISACNWPVRGPACADDNLLV